MVPVRDGRLPVTCRVELSRAGGQIASYFDRAETLLLRTASDAEESNIEPLQSETFYTISCGKKGIIKPHSLPTGVVFKDGSFLRIFEEWSSSTGSPPEYTYHYQVPNGLSIRYDMDPAREAPDQPKHHIQANAVGKDIRMPSGEVTREAALTMIFEQFLS